MSEGTCTEIDVCDEGGDVHLFVQDPFEEWHPTREQLNLFVHRFGDEYSAMNMYSRSSSGKSAYFRATMHLCTRIKAIGTKNTSLMSTSRDSNKGWKRRKQESNVDPKSVHVPRWSPASQWNVQQRGDGSQHV